MTGISCVSAQAITPQFMNSDPLSKSIPATGTGVCVSIHSKAPCTCTYALLRIVRSIVHPATGSVQVRVRRNSPLRVWPQCATVSSSQNPGTVSGASMLVRVGIDERKICEGFVPDSATG